MGRVDTIIGELGRIAEDPVGYVAGWKERHGRKAIGILPMNFPVELVHAAGALPVVVQESRVPITLGRSLIFEYYCGYTRSLVDQAVTSQLDMLDGMFIVDHCVALLGAMDAIRYALPDMPVYLAQFTASMDEPWSPPQVRDEIALLQARLAALCGVTITDQALRRSIALFNHDRALLRRVYELRRTGRIALGAAEMQVLVKSAMVMDIEDHAAAMTELVEVIAIERRPAADGVRLHFSGHFCHAPQPELLDLIESCGATVVDDDLYTGYRYISTDVPDLADPLDGLTTWYFDRNNNVPCSTRAQKTVDWESYLVAAVAADRSEGVVTLMPKFCEPHMLYFPELRKALLDRGIPHLLLETEHEGLALETVRVRVEAFVETIKRRAAVAPELA
jgi:bcr-type benzoyl-CoA reductase subunit C